MLYLKIETLGLYEPHRRGVGHQGRGHSTTGQNNLAKLHLTASGLNTEQIQTALVLRKALTSMNRSCLKINYQEPNTGMLVNHGESKRTR